MKARKTRSASAKRLKKYSAVLRAMGFTPYDFQLDLVARADDIDVVGESVPRQNGKSEGELMAAFVTGARGGTAMIFAHDRELTAALAHRAAAYAAPMKRDGLVTKITESVNINRVDFASGGAIIFKIRGSSVGVGLTLDRVIFDEAQKMSQKTLEDVLPATTRSENASIIMIGTPPTDEDLRQFGTDTPFIRQRAKGGRGWVEYGIGDYRPDHPSFTLKDARDANPAWKSIPNFARNIRRDQETLTDRAYARQRLGAWVMPDTAEYHPPEFKANEISSIMSSRGPGVDSGLYAGVGIYPDSSSAFISFSDGVRAEVIREIPVDGGDLSALVDFLSEKRGRFRILRIPANARGKALSGMLAGKGMSKKTTLSSTTETATAIQRTVGRMHDGSLRVFKNDSSAMALSSFWRGFDPRAGAVTVEAMDPSARSAMLSIALAYGDPLGKISGGIARSF